MTILSGKRGLIVGVANERSAAWGIAKKASDLGAELAFTYQIPAFEKRIAPLAESVKSDIMIPCDLSEEAASIRAMEPVSYTHLTLPTILLV